MKAMVVFDVDGVLIDSYKGIPVFYKDYLASHGFISREEAGLLLMLEYIYDQAGLLREEWWPRYLGLDEPVMSELITRYWEYRVEYTELVPYAIQVLERLKRMGLLVTSVSYKDDIYGLKMWRIQLSGIDKYLDDILVVGEDVGSRIEGIMVLKRKYGVDKVFYVDDKVQNLYRIHVVDPNITNIWYMFEYPVPYKLFPEFIPRYILSMNKLSHITEIIRKII